MHAAAKHGGIDSVAFLIDRGCVVDNVTTPKDNDTVLGTSRSFQWFMVVARMG